MVKFDRQREKRNKVHRLPLSVWISYLLVATLVMTGVTFSGYVTSVPNEDSARVAVMATDVSIPVQTQFPIQPGGSNVFKFEVTNYTEIGGLTRVCEVAQEYTLSVAPMTQNIPLVYQIYSDEACNNRVTGGSLPAGTQEIDTYWIQVSWGGIPDASMSLEVDAVTITVHAEQID